MTNIHSLYRVWRRLTSYSLPFWVHIAAYTPRAEWRGRLLGGYTLAEVEDKSPPAQFAEAARIWQEAREELKYR